MVIQNPDLVQFMKNPRIQVSLSPEAYRCLKTISDHGNTTMSAMVSNMVEGALPTLQQIADTMKQLQRLSAQLPGATAQEIMGQFDVAAWKITGGVDEAQDHFDQVQQRLAGIEAEASLRPSAGGERGGVSASSKQQPSDQKPPSINKGVNRGPRD